MSDLQAALDGLHARRANYDVFAAYYRGDQPTEWMSDKYQSAFARQFRRYSKNFCARVVDAPADRLAVTGFTVDQGLASAADAAWAIWQANRMDKGQGEAHQEALLMGDSYLIVWPGADGKPQLDVQEARMLHVQADPENPRRLLWAAKSWQQADRYVRLTLYYADRLEKYISAAPLTDGTVLKAEGLIPYAPDPTVPNPHGRVPVFHFANNTRVGRFGVSELRDILPLQDELNKVVLDRMVAMEVAALRQRYVTGFVPETDPATGKVINPWKNEPGSVWFAEDGAAKFGEFSAADLAQFRTVEDGVKADIARVSATPMHYLMLQTGDFPSGEAMRTAEAPFTAKVADRQIAFGNTWEDALAFALTLAGTPGVVLSAQWRPAESRAALEKITEAQGKKDLGIPDAVLWSELGYSATEITDMAAAGQQAAQAALARIREEQMLAMEDTRGPQP